MSNKIHINCSRVLRMVSDKMLSLNQRGFLKSIELKERYLYATVENYFNNPSPNFYYRAFDDLRMGFEGVSEVHHSTVFEIPHGREF